MKKQFLIIIITTAIFFSCNKNIQPTTNTFEGTWKYIGYSGGIAGIKFTAVNAENYLRFNSVNYLENNSGNQFCGAYNFTKVNNSNYNLLGIITFDSAQVSPQFTNKYEIYISHDTLMLYPYQIVDGFESYYIPSSKQFDWCNNIK